MSMHFFEKYYLQYISAASPRRIFLGLCKKVFAAFGGRIFFGWRLVFHDFASRNHEKQVSIQILFGAKRQEKPFYTTPKIISQDPETASMKYFRFFLNILYESHVLFWMLIFEPSGLVEREK